MRNLFLWSRAQILILLQTNVIDKIMRTAWIDNARAIGILLVVFGHTQGFGPFPKDLTYSFHMPLFFFLSGFLLKSKYLEEPFRKFVFKQFKSLVIPYASFWLVSYLLWLPTKALRSHAGQYATLSTLDPVVGLFYGVYTKLYINQVLWFFTCLFSTALLFYFFAKIKDKKLIGVGLIACGIVGPLMPAIIQFRLPWNIELSLVAMVFYALGHYLSRSQSFLEMPGSKHFPFFIVVLLALLVLVTKLNGWVNMNRMAFGNLALFYLGAFSGIGCVILLARIIPKNFISEWLSINTIIVFPLHVIIFNIFTGINVILLGLASSMKDTLAFSILYIVGAILACIPAAYIIRRFFPWMIGKGSFLNGAPASQTMHLEGSSFKK